MWHGGMGNGGTTWEASSQVNIMRKVVCKEVTARGRLDFFCLCNIYRRGVKLILAQGPHKA